GPRPGSRVSCDSDGPQSVRAGCVPPLRPSLAGRDRHRTRSRRGMAAKRRPRPQRVRPRRTSHAEGRNHGKRAPPAQQTRPELISDAQLESFVNFRRLSDHHFRLAGHMRFAYSLAVDAGALKRRRAELGLSLTEMARALGVNRMTVYKWEHGKHAIPEPVALVLNHLKPTDIKRLAKRRAGAAKREK